MKKMFIILTILLAAIWSQKANAQEFSVNEARKAITKYKVVSVDFNFASKTAVVNLWALDSDGINTGNWSESFVGVDYDTLLSAVKLDQNALTTAIKQKAGK